MSSTKTTNTRTTNNTAGHVFVLKLHDGRYVIGQATNPTKRIACINSGLNRAIPRSLQVNQIVAIREKNNKRSLPSVVKHFCERYGDEKVIAV